MMGLIAQRVRKLNTGPARVRMEAVGVDWLGEVIRGSGSLMFVVFRV